MPSRASDGGLHSLRPPHYTSPSVPRVLMVHPRGGSCPLPSSSPDPGRRQVLNLLLVGATVPVVFGVLGPYGAALAPPSDRRSTDGIERAVATDVNGAPVSVAGLLIAAPADGLKTMVVGLGGEPTWVTAAPPDHLDRFALCAVCTHMGCVVPWVPAKGKFVCPCHASEYDKEGRVLRGPAPLPLQLEHVEIEEEGGAVLLSSWTESDFRTGKAPWWFS